MFTLIGLVSAGAVVDAAEKVVLDVSAVGVYTSPQRLAKDLTGPALGWGARVGLGNPLESDSRLLDSGLMVDYVQARLSTGMVHQLAFNTPTSVPIPVGDWAFVLETTTQGGFGWTQGIPDGTELGVDSDGRYYTWGLGAGARLLTPSPFTLGYQHMWLSMESDWRIGHWFVHQLIVTGAALPLIVPMAVLREKTSKPLLFDIAGMAALWGTRFAFYTLLDYDQHNWPWDEPKPMRVSQHVLSAGVRF